MYPQRHYVNCVSSTSLRQLCILNVITITIILLLLFCCFSCKFFVSAFIFCWEVTRATAYFSTEYEDLSCIHNVTCCYIYCPCICLCIFFCSADVYALDQLSFVWSSCVSVSHGVKSLDHFIAFFIVLVLLDMVMFTSASFVPLLQILYQIYYLVWFVCNISPSYIYIHIDIHT